MAHSVMPLCGFCHVAAFIGSFLQMGLDLQEECVAVYIEQVLTHLRIMFPCRVSYNFVFLI